MGGWRVSIRWRGENWISVVMQSSFNCQEQS
jgi:hypothetical protein